MSKPPSYQVEAVMVLVKQLEVHRGNLLSMLDRTDSVLHQFKVWCDGKESETSFMSMCQAVEDALKYVTSKSIDTTDIGLEDTFGKLPDTLKEKISNTPNKMNTATEVSFQENEQFQRNEQFKSDQCQARIIVLEEAVSSITMKTHQFSKQQDDTEKSIHELNSKLSAHIEEIDINFKKESKKSNGTFNQLQSCKQNVKKLQENGLEYNSKLDNILKELSAAHGTMSDLKQQIKSLTKRLQENEVAIQRNADLLSPLKNNMDNMSHILQNSKQKLLGMQTEHRQQLEKMQQQILSVAEQCNTNYHQLYKKLSPLEKIQDTLKKELSAQDEQQKKFDRFCYKVSKLEDQFYILENQAVKKHSGFSTSLRKGLNAFTWFKGNSWIPTAQPTTDVRCNLGNNFDPKTGIYTAPIDNIYLIGLFVCKDKRSSDKSSMVLDISKRTTSNQLCVLQRLSIYENETKGGLIIIEELKKDEELIFGPYDCVKNVESSYYFCFGLN